MRTVKKAALALLMALMCMVPAFADAAPVPDTRSILGIVLVVVAVVIIIAVLALRRRIAVKRGRELPVSDPAISAGAAADAAEQFLTPEVDNAEDFGAEISAQAETGAEGVAPAAEGGSAGGAGPE